MKPWTVRDFTRMVTITREIKTKLNKKLSFEFWIPKAHQNGKSYQQLQLKIETLIITGLDWIA